MKKRKKQMMPVFQVGGIFYTEKAFKKLNPDGVAIEAQKELEYDNYMENL
jgi:hypothetical protein